MIHTMSKKMYDNLIKGKKYANGRAVKGCGDKRGVIAYINRTWGLLHKITDIRIE